jgi:hypothetical protein
MKVKELTWQALQSAAESGEVIRLSGMVANVKTIRNAAYNMQAAFPGKKFYIEVDEEDILISSYASFAKLKKGEVLFSAMLAMKMHTVKSIYGYDVSPAELRNAAPTDARYSIFTDKEVDVIYVAKVPLGERLIADENKLASL